MGVHVIPDPGISISRRKLLAVGNDLKSALRQLGIVPDEAPIILAETPGGFAVQSR